MSLGQTDRSAAGHELRHEAFNSLTQVQPHLLRDKLAANSLQYVSTQPALVVTYNMLLGAPTCVQTHCSVTVSYVHTDNESCPSFAEAPSAVSGTDYWLTV